MADLKEISWLAIELADDSPEKKVFKTYRNYLGNFATILENAYGKKDYFENLKNELDSNFNRKIERKSSTEMGKIKNLLFNSWHTELNFILPTKISGDLTKYSIHWSPVQAYYSIYLSIRALFESAQNPIDNKHAPTLGAVSEWIVHRKLFPYPWSCYCSGHQKFGNLNFQGFKEEIKEICMLSNPQDETAESGFAKFLKTTRERHFEKLKYEHCKRIKRKRLNKLQKEEIESNQHMTTLFDCIYRMRIKSNYEEIEAYLTDISERESADFYRYLNRIMSMTLFVLEYLTKSYLGKENFIKIFEEFDSKIKNAELRNEGIFLRKNHLI